MNKRAIGVFDTGLGGLCAVKEMLRLYPNEDIIYFGDTGRVPYGNRSANIIEKYSLQALRFLTVHDVKAVMVACGTVSSVAITALQHEFAPLPVIGVVEASCEKAVGAACPNILVLGTAATIKTGVYAKALYSLSDSVVVTSKECTLFVPLVEGGYFQKGNKILNVVAEEYLSKYTHDNINTVILGCTHYPMIKDTIQEFFPDSLLIDSGLEAAHKLQSVIEPNDTSCKGRLTIYVSDETYNFAKTASWFLGFDVSGNIKKVNIEDY